MDTEHLLQNTIEIDNNKYYNVLTFAQLTRRSEQAVRKLALYGNKSGKLKFRKLGRSVFILASELVNFNFLLAGTSGAMIKFNKYGQERTEFV